MKQHLISLRQRYLQRIACVIVLFYSFVPANDAARINGVVDFLIERANENYIYIFEKEMLRLPELKEYLPVTYKTIKSAGLRTLLLADRVQWKNSVEEDLSNLLSRFATNINGNLETLILDSYWTQIDMLVDALNEVKISTPGDTCGCLISVAVEYCPCKKETKELTQKARESVYGTYQEIFQYDKMVSLVSTIKNLRLNDFTKAERLNALSTTIGELNISRFREVADSVRKWRPYFTGDTSKLQKIERIGSLYGDLYTAIDCATKVADTANTFVTRIANTFSVIDFINRLTGNNIKLESRSMIEYRRYAVFFAQLADAKDPDNVKMILKAITLPPVSFQGKREYRRITVSVASYLGLGAGIESKKGSFKPPTTGDSLGFRGVGGLSTPIGIEFSKGLSCGWSVGLLFSVIDLGPVVNTMLFKKNDENNDLKWNDFISPGISLLAGIKEYPVAIGAGWYRGRNLYTGDFGEHHVFTFIAFDMPLFCWQI